MRKQWLTLMIVLAGTAFARADEIVYELAFTSMRDGNAEIYLVDSRGENLQNLTQHPAEDTLPIWSPDGAKIVFVSDRVPPYGLYQMDADGGSVQQLTLSEYEIRKPAFSPDGSQIAFIALEPGFAGAHLMLIPSEGGETVELADDITSAIWTPDGEALLGRNLSRQQLVSVSVADGTVTSLYNTYVGSFAISLDGTHVAYDYGGEFSSIDLLDIASGTVTTVSIGDGGEQTDFGAVWSPDGERMAFVIKRGDRYDITIIEPDGTNRQRLQMQLEPTHFHRIDLLWSPDGTQLAYAANAAPDEEYDVFVIDVDGEGLLNLTHDPAADADPAWRPVMP